MLPTWPVPPGSTNFTGAGWSPGRWPEGQSQSSRRLLEPFLALAEREPDLGPARLGVVIKHDVGHGDDGAAPRQVAAELQPVAGAEGRDVGGDEVGPVWCEHFEARLRQARGEHVTLAAQAVGEGG